MPITTDLLNKGDLFFLPIRMHCLYLRLPHQ